MTTYAEEIPHETMHRYEQLRLSGRLDLVSVATLSAIVEVAFAGTR